MPMSEPYSYLTGFSMDDLKQVRASTEKTLRRLKDFKEQVETEIERRALAGQPTLFDKVSGE